VVSQQRLFFQLIGPPENARKGELEKLRAAQAMQCNRRRLTTINNRDKIWNETNVVLEDYYESAFSERVRVESNALETIADTID